MSPEKTPGEDDEKRRKRPDAGAPRREWKPRDSRGGPRKGGPRKGGPRTGGPRRERDDRAPRGDRPNRDDRAPRREGSDAPRREWKPRTDRPNRDDRAPRREGRDAPRREWKPRGDRPNRDDRGPRRERGDGPRREGSDAPRREWKPRGDRPNRDDRAPRRERGDGPRRERGDGPRREGSDVPRREWKPRGDRPNRDDRAPRRERDDRGPRRERDDRGPRRGRDDRREEVPQTEAQRRRSAVFERKGPRKYGKDKPFGDRPDREERVIDEGSVRRPKFDKERRGPRDSARSKPRTRRRDDGPMFPTPPALQEPLAGEVRRAVGDRRYESVSLQLSQSLVAYDAERYREALSVLSPVLEDLWLIADVRVLAGRLEYRAQRWKAAAEHLEFARASDRVDMTNMPVLIDCYRALKRYETVDELWSELKEASPHPMIMAEGRVSAAMSYADRGDVQSAIRIMTHGTDPRQVQLHHLLEWYVLGDLHDRAGDPVSAKRFFTKVAKSDAKYFDVVARLATLGN